VGREGCDGGGVGLEVPRVLGSWNLGSMSLDGVAIFSETVARSAQGWRFKGLAQRSFIFTTYSEQLCYRGVTFIHLENSISYTIG
jgi:hypothetical protein